MMPMLPLAPSPSVATAYARVDKATSEFLNCPDWRINIGICDAINSKPWLAKDYVKALRSRLQHKNPNVQLLSLTREIDLVHLRASYLGASHPNLMETMVKNCADHLHAQIAERKILHEMIKIVKKKTHMRVREKILVLIDTWQEAFGGRRGKHAHYHHAYEELRRYGVEFPRRSPNTAPIFTPPATQPSSGHPQTGVNSSSTTSWNENLSVSTLESMRNVSDLLSDMLQAVDPKDRAAVKDEVIVDLTDQCRSNQKKLGQMLASTTNEELLRQSLEFNDTLQYLLEKHDAIASGSMTSFQASSSANHPTHNKQIESTEVNSKSSSVPSAPLAHSSMNNEGKEEQNNSVLIASRHYETQTVASQNGSATVTASKTNEKTALDVSLTMAIVLSDPPPPANKKNTEDMIDFLSLALAPAKASTSNIDQTPPPLTIVENQPPPAAPMNSYVVPWAQAQAQVQPQPELEMQHQVQTIQQQAGYIPPPWAPTPGYYCNPYASAYSAARSGAYGGSSGEGLNPYIPSYRLFEDLNVLGNLRTSSTAGTSGPSMLGGHK